MIFFYQSEDSLDTTTAGQTADCWLCDALDVVTQDFAMAPPFPSPLPPLLPRPGIFVVRWL
jgi:hypothetical protein